MKKILLLVVAIIAVNLANAQCPALIARKSMASSFHSSVLITHDGIVRYWGDAADISGTGNVATPLTLAPTSFGGASAVPLSVAAGSTGFSTHQLFIHSSLGLYGWGVSNNTIVNATSGQVGITNIALPSGVAIADVDFIEAAVGGLCLVTTSGIGWVKKGASSSGSGRLYGDGSTTLNTAWHRVETSSGVALSGIIRISMAEDAMMAVTSGGNAYVWGENTYLGDGSAIADRAFATLMAAPAVGVTAADVNICSRNGSDCAEFILGSDGRMYAVGENARGTLGQGNTTDLSTWAPVKDAAGTGILENITLIGSNNALQTITTPAYAVGALTSSGNLYLWGDNNNRMLGSDTVAVPSIDPTFYDLPRIPPSFSRNLASIGYFEMGGHTTAAFLSGTSKFCYVGHRINGSMGDGATGGSTRYLFDCINTPGEYVCPPAPVVGCPLPSASDLISSSNHATVAINGNPAATMWGEGASSAEPGIDMVNALTLFEYNGTPKGTAASAVAETPSAAATQMWIHTTQGIWGWGFSANTIIANKPGALPIANLALPSGVTASDVSFIRSSKGGIAIVTTAGAVYVRAGAASVCSPRVYGDGSASLDAFGSTVWHQVTDASSVNLTGVTQLSFGGTAAIAITSSGAAYVWGDNTYLGDGSAAANRTRATLMTLHSDFTGTVKPRSAEIIQSGANEAVQFILGTNNKVYSLGRNLDGALGTGTASTTAISTTWNSLSLVGIRNMSSNNQAPQSFYSVGAMDLLGNVKLWGSNDNGMIGLGAATNATSPTAASTVAANDAANFEIGGHGTIIFVKSVSNFYFSGHAVGGSRADGTSGTSTTTFALSGSVQNCANTSFSISGHLYQDNNALTDNLVNGTGITSVGGVAMHANLLDEGGYVIATTPILAGGNFSFAGVQIGNYIVQIASTPGSIFALAPTTAGLPTGWKFGGEQIGTTAGVGIDAGIVDGRMPVALAANTSNVNFGVTPPPPVANNIAAPRMNNSLATTAIPQLQASSPINTNIDIFTIQTIPAPASGVLYYCATPGPGCATTAVTAGTVLTYAQSKSLFFDPAASFTGTASYTYNVQDANGLVSNTASYVIPVYNNPPVTQNVTAAAVANTAGAAAIPGLIAADVDGTISTYSITGVPAASQGILTYCVSGTLPGCTPTTITGSISGLTAAQMSTFRFDPDPSFTGSYQFDYTALDNNSNVSNSSKYTIPVVAPASLGGNLPPVATNIIAQNINNSSAATAIPNLLGTDPDGTVVSYTIGATVPPASEGVLSYCATGTLPGCTASPVTAGMSLTPAQAATLRFDPAATFIGTASFTYTATDNYGTPLTSAPATYQIPVVNTPPVANPDRVAAISNTLTTPTLLPPLSGSDYDGTVVTYNITSVPAAAQGTLKYCVGPAACTAGTLTTISGPLSSLTPAQIATLNFIPNASFTGDYVFNFTTVDNNSLVSQPAPFTIPVVAAPITVGEPPLAYSFNNAPISSLGTAALTTALTGTDPDGTIANYTVRSITPANEGVLTYCTTPPATGCGTAVTVGLTLTSAQAATVLFTPNANYTGTSTFTYSNTDNSGNGSNIATVTIPVVNNPPVARNIPNSPIQKTASATALNPLASTDADGTVVSYKILTIPTPSEGTLRVCTTAPSTGCTPVAAGDVLTPTQINQLAFTPNPTAVNNIVNFLYSTNDNSGNTGNIALASIGLFDPLIIPPVANNITAPPLNNSLGRTAIPQLQASNPSGTAISTYNVLTLPPASEGVLYYCTTGISPVCAVGALTAVSTSTPLTPAQSATLYFDPAATFTGNSSFTYNAVDANSLTSNTANYTIPVVNEPPVTINIRTTRLIDTTDRFYLPKLVGADKDGSVASYTVSSIPGSGAVLSYCVTGSLPGCTISTISGTTVLTPSQMMTLEIDPTTGFSGDFVFNYIATDNNGNTSNLSTYTIPIGPVSWSGYGNQPPVATNITSQNINNSLGATPIPNLLGTDPDGSVVSYTIGGTVPPASEGVLSYCATGTLPSCTASPVTAGMSLTPAQAATLRFDPASTFVGVASFTYTATDNDGVPLTSAPATYQIPVVNIRPVANPDRVAPIANTVTTPTRLSPLTGSDYDGTVVTYNITSVPPSTSGTLQYCVTGSMPSCVLSTISTPITGLTATQVATLNFIPNSGFTGDYTFNFSTVDNNGLVSLDAPFTVPVVAFDVTPGEPPIAFSFNAPAMSSGAAATLLTGALTGTDPDGTIASYAVTSITPANEGVLTYCTTPPATGCGTAVTVGLVLTPAQALTVSFDPNANFTGTSTFTYTNLDNDGNLSNTATVTIPVVNNPPVSTNVNNAVISRFSPATALNPLSSTDADGSVVSYTILTIPQPQEGVLSVCTTAPSTGCTPVTVGQVLTPAQIAQLAFTPNIQNNSPVITFLYSTTDNSGNVSNVAAANIPMADAEPLPVELLNFTAKKNGKNALVEWMTGVEEAGMKYQLEHSLNAQTWNMINSQVAKNNGLNENTYSYVHTNLTNGNHFYRLKVVDVDNSAKYSPVRIVTIDNNQTYTIIVHPNPVTENVTISTSDASLMSEVSIYSNEGKMIQSFTQVNSGTVINMNNYASGFYMIKIKDKNGEMQVIKLSKK